MLNFQCEPETNMIWTLSNFQGSHLQPLLAMRPWARNLFSLWLISFAKIGLMQAHLARAKRIKGVNLYKALTAAFGTCLPFPGFYNNYLIDEDA